MVSYKIVGKGRVNFEDLEIDGSIVSNVREKWLRSGFGWRRTLTRDTAFLYHLSLIRSSDNLFHIESGLRTGQETKIFLPFPKRPNRFWDPPILVFNGHRKLSPWWHNSRQMRLSTVVVLLSLMNASSSTLSPQALQSVCLHVLHRDFLALARRLWILALRVQQ
jgi:hypothetical protein